MNSFAKFHRRSLSDALEVAIARKAYHTGRGEHVALAGVEFVVPAGHEADGLSDQHCTRSDRRSADYHAFLASRASTVSGVSTVAAHIYRPLALSTSAHLGYSYNWR